MKPKITISNFSGMGQGGSYYLDGMRPHKLGNESILTTGHKTEDFQNEDDTNASGLGLVKALTDFSGYETTLANSAILAYNGSNIVALHPTTPASNWGTIHTVADGTSTGTTNEIADSTKPDIVTTINGNILYTSANHIGIGYIGVATGGSTTTLIDTNVNFVADFGLDASPSAGANKLYNITKNEIYTITSITTTTETNDTLNFDAGTAVEAADQFIVFIDNKFASGELNAANAQFRGQVTLANWARQMILVADEYWITNGNYLSSLNIDESTFAAEAKQLPYQHQATCLDYNQQNILVGADYKGFGKLLLWDTYTNGWLSIVETPTPPTAIRAYKNGWVVVVNNALYYTNGYEIQKLSSFPDMEAVTDATNVGFNAIETTQEKIYVGISSDKYTRAKTGLWAFNPTTGWEYAPLSTPLSTFYYGDVGAIKKISFFEANNYFLVSGYNAYATSNYVVNKFYEDTTDATKYSAILYVKLPEKMRMSKIEFNLGTKYKDVAIDKDASVDVTMSYGDGNSNIWGYATVGNGSTTTSIVNTNGDNVPAKVGQQIMILDDDNGGSTSWITAIANAETATETWTISPALPYTPVENANISIIDLKKSETKTVDPKVITKSLDFNISDFYSDKLFLQVSFDATYNNLDLHSINIY